MTYPAEFWPGLLGISFFVAGIITYWRDFRAAPPGVSSIGAFGPVFVGAALATFAGEHFTSTADIASAVPKWLPAHVFFAYFVGGALLAAGSSFVARRCVRWSAPSLALMFALFVLLMDLPKAVTHPTMRLAWSLAAREATYSIGALALFATATASNRPGRAVAIARIARFWTAAVLVFYGLENILFPRFTPGVPDAILTPAGVPMARAITFATGVLLIGCGGAMFSEKSARHGATACGLLMTLLTAAIYVPQWAIAGGAAAQLLAINFVFDTLLFAGVVLIVGQVITTGESKAGRPT